MKHYCFNCGNELKEEQLLCPKCGHCSFLDALENSTLLSSEMADEIDDNSTNPAHAGNASKSVAGVLTASQIEENMQWAKYKCGKNGLTGHGFAAEDVNTINDIWYGKNVERTGWTNSKNGPDRIVNGQAIQTKYCKTARESVQAGFDAETGMYAYENQVLEVPSDQYEEAVKIMQEKISSGKVNGVTNPDEASEIIRKGSVTYRQTKNIAKAGNIDSLMFDAKTQTITAVSAFGISFAINLGMLLYSNKRKELNITEAIQLSFLTGLKNGTITMASGILSSQVLRTQFGRNFAAFIQGGAKYGIDSIYKTNLGKEFTNRLSQTLIQKNIYGGAAKNVVIKYLRTNIITNVTVAIAYSVPDTYHWIKGEISSPNILKT